MEHYNRMLKQHLPPGVPTLQDWVTASRCDEPLKKIRESIFNQLNVKDSGNDQSNSVTFSQEREIQMFRAVIRNSSVLENPTDLLPFKSLDGQQLHPDLVNFMCKCKENFENYIMNGKDTELSPLFVTISDEETFNDVKTWTNSKILQECEKLIS